MDKKDPENESIFETRGRDSVIFDLDDTLFQTNLFFKENMLAMSDFTVSTLHQDTSPEEYPRLANEIYEEAVRIYKESGKPLLLNILMKEAIKNIYGEEMEEKDKIHEYIDKAVEKFYESAPQLFPQTLDVLEMLISKGIQFAVYSHAQLEWTRVKILELQRQFEEKYNKEIVIPYFTTPIDAKKDSDGWIKAIKEFGFDVSRTLIVGDNLRDDILAPHSAGISNIAYISKERPIDLDPEIIDIRNVGDLLTL